MIIGESADVGELLWNGIFGFILGFKVVYAIINSDEFFMAPQKAILSLKGNLFAGLLTAAAFIFLKYRELVKQGLLKSFEFNPISSFEPTGKDIFSKACLSCIGIEF